MRNFTASRLWAAGLSAAAAVTLAGCNSMTYGTGTTPAMQTVEDLTGMVAINKPKADPIVYTPRAPIVQPPPQAADNLPPPGTDTTDGAALSADWPKDPDVEIARFKKDIAEREKTGQPLPKINVDPEQLRAAEAALPPDPNKPLSPEEQARVRKAFADAKGSVAIDENGNPVRRYLSDPPVAYRAPDPESTVDVNAPPPKDFTKKKKKWWPF